MSNILKIFLKISWLVAIMMFSYPAYSATDVNIDTLGVAEPPFLAMGAKSNLLLLLDNSASMLDMAYVAEVGECVDDSYNPNTVYTGLFNNNSWYQWVDGTTPQWFSGNEYYAGDYVYSEGIYYQATEKFSDYSVGYRIDDDTSYTWEKVTNVETLIASGAISEGAFEVIGTPSLPSPGTNETTYSQDELYIRTISVDIIIHPKTYTFESGVNYFAATGNLLNWASASKFDIQKKVLTGGKYDPVTQRLVSESRGCSARGFVKEVAVKSSNGGSKYISLSVEGGNVVNRINASDDTTRIIIKGLSTVKYVGSDRDIACQAAIASITAGYDDGLGTTKGNIQTCLAYDTTINNVGAASNAAYNHSVFSCWKMVTDGEKGKFDGAEDFGNTSEVENACAGVYANDKTPDKIATSDSGYVCSGWGTDSVNSPNYVGDCWDPGTEATEGTWITGDPSSDSTCVQDALLNYCQDLSIAQVVDPSDETLATGNTLGMVGALVDASIDGIFTDHDLIVMKGYIKPSEMPEGVIQEYASDLRIGAMAFNDNGAGEECDNAAFDDMVDEACPDSNRDGAYLVAPINDEQASTEGYDPAIDGISEHLEYVTSRINSISATSWTPLAEAFYNALGYYGQNADRCVNGDDNNDFTTATDPITNWCQNNFVLIVTEGASTADVDEQVQTFVTGLTVTDTDTDTGGERECVAADGTHILYGSTYLDDLTYFGQKASAGDIYTDPQQDEDDGKAYDKRNITTFIVTTGGLRDDGSDNECNPKTIMTNAATNGGSTLIAGEKPEDLEKNLRDVFSSLRERASAGSAASVVSSSRGGEGAVYQAIFWPELSRTDGTTGESYTVAWAGDVRALFIDSNGYLFDDSAAPYNQLSTEDTNGDGVLNVDDGEDKNGNGLLDGDRRVIVYYDADDPKPRSKACYNDTIYDGACTDGDDLEDVAFLWSAGSWLARNDLNTAENRPDHISNEIKRRIFTWNDLNNNGVVDRDPYDITKEEWIDFEVGTDWANLVVAPSRSSIYADFDVSRTTEVEELAKVNDIVNWVRGADRLNATDIDSNSATEDEPALRSRQVPEGEGKTNIQTWRLGDVIYSTPMAVSSPSEGYHLLYNDYSYAEFVNHWKDRRHVIYFGANDGMLHAVNGGFYIEEEKKFCRNLNSDGVCDESASTDYPDLGAELWAYVPYNILPHLQSLTKVDYKHKYYVDLRPRIFDVKIFPVDNDHPNGWGTILVGGMRLGGVTVDAKDLDGADPDDSREFISSYFIFDITNPEKEPTLLGELTRSSEEPYLDSNGNGTWDSAEIFTDLNRNDVWDGDASELYADMGQSTNIATMVIMRKFAEQAESDENDYVKTEESNDWYLVLGSGPHGPEAMKGVSDQEAQLAVLPLNWLTDKKAFRIPNEKPAEDLDYGGRFLLADSDAPVGFVSDAITIDMDINPSTIDYMSDVVYFGTVEGGFSDEAGENTWTGEGAFYRLVTRDLYEKDNKIMSFYGKNVEQMVTTPDQWQIKLMLDAKRPITAAQSVAYDGYNFWVYGGTGRFWDADDKRDNSQQAYFGMKESMSPSLTDDGVFEFSWATLPNVSYDELSNNFPGSGIPGEKGLLRVDEIEVKKADSLSKATLSCEDETINCLPLSPFPTSPNLGDLIEYTSGKGRTDIDPLYSQSADGWYKLFYPDYNDRQRNLGQPTLLGGLLVFTTYQPFDSSCMAEGLGYLYGVYYETGTSWHEPIFSYPNSTDIHGNVVNQMFLGSGLAETPNLFVGQGKDGKVSAYVQTSTGEVQGITIENLPLDTYYTGRTRWKSCAP